MRKLNIRTNDFESVLEGFDHVAEIVDNLVLMLESIVHFLLDIVGNVQELFFGLREEILGHLFLLLELVLSIIIELFDS